MSALKNPSSKGRNQGIEGKKEMPLALQGIRIVDVAQVTAVPMAARHLADFGADVIHVEPLVTGDACTRIRSAHRGVLLEHGYTWEDIEQFKQQGIIA